MALGAFPMTPATLSRLAEVARKARNGVYVASRTHHAELWRRCRDHDGYNIISTWIDEAGQGQTADLGELWQRIHHEVCSAERLVFFVEAGDFPLKGALIEIGMALATGVPVFMVADPDIPLEIPSMRPIGSWMLHPGVRQVGTLYDAFNETPAPPSP